ncbi:hypothetical protein [Paenibacillus sp. LPE1-1-1.1]
MCKVLDCHPGDILEYKRDEHGKFLKRRT